MTKTSDQIGTDAVAMRELDTTEVNAVSGAMQYHELFNTWFGNIHVRGGYLDDGTTLTWVYPKGGAEQVKAGFGF